MHDVEELHPVHHRHLQVGDDDVEVRGGQALERGLAVHGVLDVMAGAL